MEKKPQDTESRHADKYVVRFPDGMRDKIAEAAKANNRSMNAEIVARLQSSIEPKQDDRLIRSLTDQVIAYKALLRRAAGSIQMALIRGRTMKIPDEDCRWLEAEYKDLARIAHDDNHPGENHLES